MRLPLLREKFTIVRLKVPNPCCPWCDSHTARLEEALKALRDDMASLKAHLDRVQAESRALPEGRLQASLQILRCVINSDHVQQGCSMIAPETVTNVFKAIYRAVDEALVEHGSVATRTDPSIARSAMPHLEYQPEPTPSRNGRES